MESYCPECDRTFELSAGVCPFDQSELLPAEEAEDPYLDAVLDDRYRLDSRIADGGMGVVYRARQLAVDRDVAVKVLDTETDHPEETHRRFTQEAQHISALSHPNIVQLIDFGRDSERDIWFLVMELVRGANLRSLLRGGPVDYELALEVVYQVCAALSESHERNTVHQDLKPENLHLEPVADGTLQVKVLDFGIARCVERAGTLERSNSTCGSPGYMSPEQAQGRDVDRRADFYALGIILFEMLTGRLPFRADDAVQYMYKKSVEEFPPLSEFLPETRERELLQELVDRLVAKEPEHRPEDARAIRRHVEEIREELDLPIHGMQAEIRDISDLRDRTEKGARPGTEAPPEGREDVGVRLAADTRTFPTLEVTKQGIQSPETMDALPSVSGDVDSEGGASTAGSGSQPGGSWSPERVVSEDETGSDVASDTLVMGTQSRTRRTGWAVGAGVVAVGTVALFAWGWVGPGAASREGTQATSTGQGAGKGEPETPAEATAPSRGDDPDDSRSQRASETAASERSSRDSGVRQRETGRLAAEGMRGDAGEEGERESAGAPEPTAVRAGEEAAPAKPDEPQSPKSEREASGPRQAGSEPAGPGDEEGGGRDDERSAGRTGGAVRESDSDREPEDRSDPSTAEAAGEGDDETDSFRKMLENGELREVR